MRNTLVAAWLLACLALAAPVAQAPRTIEITVADNMRFDPPTIEARPGEALRVVLRDTGTLPKAAMAHNFVLLRAGANPKAFVQAAAGAHDTDFLPPAMKDRTLAATKLVGPGETSEVTFTAPGPGKYEFVCTFPGHFNLGMRGTLTVK